MNEQNTSEWQAPPPPEKIVDTSEPAQMSEAATITGIFFEPGRTFEDLRRKPRFIWATLIIVVLATSFSFLLANKIGEKGFRQFALEQLEKSSQASSLSQEQKERSVDLQMTIMKVSRFLVPVFIIIGLGIGGLIYWLGGNAMGGAGTFWHGLSAWVYSSLPPSVIMMLGNIIVLLFKPAEEIEVATSQRGLLHANPSFFIDGKESPVLATLLGTLDLFAIWGWVLAAIGLQKLFKISSGSAWGIVLIMALISLTVRVIFALLNGTPM
ncbi:MAG TPA: Yip1 family protein [Pyrinomonadaceae bacterium]|jgi:hypothetical protein